MKTLLTSLMVCGALAASAQSNPGNINGSSTAGNGNAYSNGNIPSQYEQNQNRPDSTLRNSDTTYMKQQWNSGAAQQQQNSNTTNRSKSDKKQTGTSNNKKK